MAPPAPRASASPLHNPLLARCTALYSPLSLTPLRGCGESPQTLPTRRTRLHSHCASPPPATGPAPARGGVGKSSVARSIVPSSQRRAGSAPPSLCRRHPRRRDTRSFPTDCCGHYDVVARRAMSECFPTSASLFTLIVCIRRGFVRSLRARQHAPRFHPHLELRDKHARRWASAAKEPQPRPRPP